MKRIAILGGGIAGLAAAYELTKRDGLEVVIFEASPRLGGIISTVNENGFTMDGGPDGWVTEKPWAQQLVEELGLGDEIISSLDAQRRTYILQHGALIPIPDGMRMMVPLDLDAMRASPLFSEEAKRACEDEPGRAEELRRSAPTGDESIASFVRRHFGDEMLRKVGAPLLSGVFGGNVETLSVRAVMPQFVTLEREYGSLITALRERAQGGTTRPIFTSLRSGMGALVDALVARIPDSWLRLNTAVSSLQRTPEDWLVDGETFQHVCLSTPVHIARKLLASTDARAAELMQMETSSAAAVALGFAEHFDLPKGFGFLVPENKGEHEGQSQLLACTFSDQKYPGRAPADKRLLRAFFGGKGAEYALSLDNAALIALAHKELSAVLGSLPEPEITAVSRLPRSLPQYATGHLDRMAELNERVQQLGNLSLLGNGYRGVGLPDLIRDARAAAAGL